MKQVPGRFVFLCGAHFDQMMRLHARAIEGVSNPAVIETYPGGAALNVASIAAALGLHSTLVSPIGDDAWGMQLRDICRIRTIEDGLVIQTDQATGLYAAILDLNGHVIIAASDLKIYNCIDQQWLALNLKPRQAANGGLFVTANQNTDILKICMTMSDFIAAATISPAKAARLRPFLGEIDILFTNRIEAATLCDNLALTAEAAAKILMKSGAKCGVISDGADAVWAWNDGNLKAYNVLKTNSIVDVNGAGDTLSGAILASLSAGYDFDQSMSYGLAAASRSLGYVGPFQPGLGYPLLDQFLEKWNY